MTKPWEQEWRTRMQVGETECAVYDDGGRMVADLRLHMEVAEESERAHFISAAPDMARALMEVRTALAYGALDRDGAMEVIERALRKAGVLPESTGG